MTFLCDRCSNPYEPHPDWTRCPLCPECLIAQRRTETIDACARLLTRRELETAWRNTLFNRWQQEMYA